MAYCHCDSCRRWSAGQVSAFTLWKPEMLQVAHGHGNIDGFNGNPGSGDETVYSVRKWCRNCGGHVFSEHPTMGLVDVPAVLVKGLVFSPAFHVHYQESVHHMKDGLPKLRDLPEAAGGSGVQLPE